MISAKLLLAYMLATNNLNLANSVDVDQAYCFAANIYHEARGESIAGQIAVGNVVLKRVHDSRFPDTVCGVVYSKSTNKYTHTLQCQFSWYCDDIENAIVFRNSLDEHAFAEAARVSLLMLGGVLADNTNGSTHYYNHTSVYPAWAALYTPTVVIGRHTFLRREKDSLI